ncbi:MAG: Nramp family divalent metal transporter [Planctomycetia bacterium]|nr:Nramp family divalent metal transporter [Planctomycetia bacterium]
MTSSASDESARTPTTGTVAPPTTLFGILRRLGPGLIIAASIVGSGELIGTTKTGAEAGYTLLWLILIGCVIKVFIQIEFGRYALAEGVPTIEALDQIPGPRLHVSWLVWAWFLMFLTSAIGQLGGILGGVGQALAMTFPITGDFLEHLKHPDVPLQTYDDVTYSVIITIVTSILLVNGRYSLIQNVSTILVAGFTAVTIFNVFALPSFSDADIGWNNIKHGLSFYLPAKNSVTGVDPLAVALATFGIIGVGASELIAYPYWCIERGYARYTGVRDRSPEWAERARGWMRVMRYDAWCSMLIYTFATVAFYVLGAAVLFKKGLSPKGSGMIHTLSLMYKDVFDPWGEYVFLLGAFAVLYSTLFVATAGNARVAADALGVFRITGTSEATKRRWIKILSAAFPFTNLIVYVISKDPVALVIIAGLAQAVLLPMLGVAGLYFRYKKCDPRIAPGKVWDFFLWLSVAGLAVAGGWGAYAETAKMAKQFFGS